MSAAIAQHFPGPEPFFSTFLARAKFDFLFHVHTSQGEDAGPRVNENS
jgi:hypothetical protein